MNEKKITFIVLGILVVGLIVSGLSSATYALFSSDDYGTNIEAYNTGLLAIEAKSKSDIISLSNALPMSDEDGLETTPYVFTIKNIGNLDYQFDVKLLSTGSEDETFPSSLIKLQINDGEVTTLANLTDGKLNTDKITLLAGETIDFSIRIWLSIDTTNEYIGRTFDSEIVTDGQAIYTSSNNEAPPINLITHINNLYASATKTTATNNSITYNYASEIGMMNDRLGGTTEDYDAGNIRYYGADPNNYIYYNCENYDNPTEETCELWRIIGVFKDIEVIEDGTTVTKDMVKIARASTIGTYAWDNKSSGLGTNTATGSNDWTDARLMMLLNPGYDEDVTDASGNLLNEHGRSYYWDSGSGSCYAGSNNATTTCDFTSTGLKNDETRNMIAKVVWNLGGWNTANGVYSNKLYEYERGTTVYTGRATEWEGHVALMYPSDYGYATDFTKCTKEPYNYETSGCYDNDWLYQTSTIQWLLTPTFGYSYYAWIVYSSGYAAGGYNIYLAYGVRPVLYLDSEIDIESGNAGTSSDPYRISVS